MISVIIPARNEPYLAQTIHDIYAHFTGDFEVIVMLDGPSEYRIPCQYKNFRIRHKEFPGGIRPAINAAVEIAQGDYILKLDAHCALSHGFDDTLMADMQDDWIVVARRYTLDPETWRPCPRVVDYYYLSCPWTHPRPLMMQSCPWITRTGERDVSIDDLMCFQGSMWLMSRAYWERLGGLGLDLVYAEHHELSMKAWLGGGRVVINKRAWYAHPARIQRGYRMSMAKVYQDHDTSARYWTENRWEERVHDFDWLIDKFWPLPTEKARHRTEKYYWPEDWRGYYGNAERDRIPA